MFHHTEQIQIIAERVNYTPNGLFTAEDWKNEGGYTVYLPENDQSSSFPRPAGKPGKDLLHVPAKISKDIGDILGNILRHNLVKKKDSDRKVVNTISAWFKNESDTCFEAAMDRI